jgi:hypothetical protein
MPEAACNILNLSIRRQIEARRLRVVHACGGGRQARAVVWAVIDLARQPCSLSASPLPCLPPPLPLPTAARHTDSNTVRERARCESNADDGRWRWWRVWGTGHWWTRRPRRRAPTGRQRRAEAGEDGRFGVGKEEMTWHGGTHELGIRIGKLLEQIVF